MIDRYVWRKNFLGHEYFHKAFNFIVMKSGLMEYDRRILAKAVEVEDRIVAIHSKSVLIYITIGVRRLGNFA